MPLQEKYWLSPAVHCDTCGVCFNQKVGAAIYDAATKQGPYALMCHNCFTFGPGLGRLGTGRGQQYTKQADGKWLRTGG